MGQRGPSPKPTELKKLHGTYRPDRAPANEAEPNPASPYQLKAPEWLNERATDKWKSIVHLKKRSLGVSPSSLISCISELSLGKTVKKG